MENLSSKKIHAYTIIFFHDNAGIKILSGRERALHPRALELFYAKSLPFETLFACIEKGYGFLDETGSNALCKIWPNLCGIFLSGRTAFPGGQKEINESFKQTAIRELKEEFAMHNVISSHLTLFKQYFLNPLHSEVYYTLDLDRVDLKPFDIIENFNRGPTDEKRCLQVLSPKEIIEKLKAPDEEDKNYIREQLEDFTFSFCQNVEKNVGRKLSAHSKNALLDNFYRYQINRRFNSVVAAQDFLTFIHNPCEIL